MPDLGEQAVQIMLRASTITLSVLLQAAQAAAQRHKGIQHGEQKIEKLNMQGKQLENVTLMDEDIKSFRKELKKYGVDFAVVKDKQTGEHSVFFKGQDIERVYMSLEKVLNTAIDRSDKGKKPAKEIMQEAVKKAAEKNAQIEQQPEKNRSADRGER